MGKVLLLGETEKEVRKNPEERRSNYLFFVPVSQHGLDYDIGFARAARMHSHSFFDHGVIDEQVQALINANPNIKVEPYFRLFDHEDHDAVREEIEHLTAQGFRRFHLFWNNRKAYWERTDGRFVLRNSQAILILDGDYVHPALDELVHESREASSCYVPARQ